MFYYTVIDENNKKTSKTTLELEKPIIKYEGVELGEDARKILQTHFVYSVLGKPGSGKSHLISELLNKEKFYGTKFNRIIYITPTHFNGIVHDEYNTSEKLNMDWIYKHIDEASTWGCKNMLIVMDDVISEIPKTHPNPLQTLFYNRRHLLKKGCISILFTTQKYTTTPKWLRDCCTGIFIFPTMQAESEMVTKECVSKIGKKAYAHTFSNLEKHKFAFINMENNSIYDHRFVEI